MFRYLKQLLLGNKRSQQLVKEALAHKHRTMRRQLFHELLDSRAMLAADLSNLDMVTASESGTSLTDNVTNINQPSFTVDFTQLTFLGEDVQLRDGSPSGTLLGSLIISTPVGSPISTTTSVINTNVALADGLHTIHAIPGATGSGTHATLSITIDTTAPTFSTLSSSVDTTDEDTEVEITFSELETAGDQDDDTTSVDSFVVLT